MTVTVRSVIFSRITQDFIITSAEIIGFSCFRQGQVERIKGCETEFDDTFCPNFITYRNSNE